MLMAYEAVCVSSQKGRGFCGEGKTHNMIDHFECQSSFSCCYDRVRKSDPQEINGTVCYSASCIDQEIFKTNSGAPCNGESTSLDMDHEAFITEQLPHTLRQQKGITTSQDSYMEDYHNDEEEDDSEWEPANHIIIKKWFCANCTVSNFDDVCHCDVCGEHKESEISGYETFCFYIGQAAQTSIDSDEGHYGHDSPSEICTSIGFDERMLLHSEVEGKLNPHPERPDRLRAIAAGLASAGIFPGKCRLIPAREITREELQLVHSLDHIETVQHTSRLYSSYFTPDTYANEHSACAARIAAGLCADLAHSIISGRSRNGFALVRPPGHHAGIKQAMGFCLHNNAAIAALVAQSAGAKKVLILDWDVHHGNGTQEIFESNNSVLYISLHGHEGGMFYPGTGAADEVKTGFDSAGYAELEGALPAPGDLVIEEPFVEPSLFEDQIADTFADQIGSFDAKGYSVNVPWSCGGVGDNDYIFAFQNIVLPIASEFAPDITIISAGFDAARGDPLGCCDVTPTGYAQMTQMLTALSKGKLLIILEGGYNLRSISSSATAVVKVLLGENSGCEMSSIVPSKAGLQTVLQVLKIQLEFWPILKSNYTTLQSQSELVSSNMKNQAKRRHSLGPIWWKWGSKRFVYKLLFKWQRHAKRICS